LLIISTEPLTKFNTQTLTPSGHTDIWFHQNDIGPNRRQADLTSINDQAFFLT